MNGSNPHSASASAGASVHGGAGEIWESDSPQLLLRIGYATPDRATPRRSVADVVTSTGTPS